MTHWTKKTFQNPRYWPVLDAETPRRSPIYKVYGLDMTEEMLALALQNKRASGLNNVEFLKGYIEDIPLPAETVDVVISNCVINLSIDKPKVFAEMFRVLRPGGRIGIADVVADNEITPEERKLRGSYVGCIAGALSFDEYEQQLKAAGFNEITIAPTHESAPGMHSSIIKASQPAATASQEPASTSRRLNLDRRRHFGMQFDRYTITLLILRPDAPPLADDALNAPTR
jgi:arsenite methyltransferase